MISHTRRKNTSNWLHSVLEQRKQWQKQYISIGKTDLFYNSTGLCGNLTPQNTSVGVNTTFLFFSALILFPFVKIMISLLSYLLVYKSTFYDQKFSPKNHLRLIHESYTKTWPKQSRKLVWSPLGKPSL